MSQLTDDLRDVGLDPVGPPHPACGALELTGGFEDRPDVVPGFRRGSVRPIASLRLHGRELQTALPPVRLSRIVAEMRADTSSS